MTPTRVIPVRDPIYRWSCDYCEGGDTYEPGTGIGKVTAAARRHIIESNGDCHSVDIVRIVRWVETTDSSGAGS